MTSLHTLLTLAAPTLEHVCDIAVTIAAPVEVGTTVFGLRRMIPITGGSVKGPRMNGKILAGGADFQLIVGHMCMQWLCANPPKEKSI